MMRNSIPCLGIIRIRCKGFDLSLSFNLPGQIRHPYWYRRQRYSFFGNVKRKKFLEEIPFGNGGGMGLKCGG